MLVDDKSVNAVAKCSREVQVDNFCSPVIIYVAHKWSIRAAWPNWAVTPFELKVKRGWWGQDRRDVVEVNRPRLDLIVQHKLVAPIRVMEQKISTPAIPPGAVCESCILRHPGETSLPQQPVLSASETLVHLYGIVFKNNGIRNIITIKKSNRHIGGERILDFSFDHTNAEIKDRTVRFPGYAGLKQEARSQR
jgi:hypothetical protein